MTLRYHPVSAAVSRGCPEPLGRFPRATHPCAAPGSLRALDLHVLGMPPAFVLSQDQTLRLPQGIPIPTQINPRQNQRRPTSKNPLSFPLSHSVTLTKDTKNSRCPSTNTKAPAAHVSLPSQIQSFKHQKPGSEKNPRTRGRRGLYASPRSNVKRFIDKR